MSLRAELSRYFRADKPATANDCDLHDEPFRVAFDWLLGAAGHDAAVDVENRAGDPDRSCRQDGGDFDFHAQVRPHQPVDDAEHGGRLMVDGLFAHR